LPKFALATVAGRLAPEPGILPLDPADVRAGVGACFMSWVAQRGSLRPKEQRDVIDPVRSFMSAHGDSRFQKSERDDRSEPEQGEMIVPDRAGWVSADAYLFATDTFNSVVVPRDVREAGRVLASVTIPPTHRPLAVSRNLLPGCCQCATDHPTTSTKILAASSSPSNVMRR